MSQKTSEIETMQKQNADLTKEYEKLTLRLLEEKHKMVEIMNEANKTFEESAATRMSA